METKHEVQTAEPKVETTRERPVYAPDTDIYETDEAIVLVADMPGLDEKSVQVELENDVLTIAGRAPEPGIGDLAPVYREFCEREYRRSFSLNAEVARENIRAQMRNGVLKLTLPKAAPAAPRRIAVEAAV